MCAHQPCSALPPDWEANTPSDKAICWLRLPMCLSHRETLECSLPSCRFLECASASVSQSAHATTASGVWDQPAARQAGDCKASGGCEDCRSPGEKRQPCISQSLCSRQPGAHAFQVSSLWAVAALPEQHMVSSWLQVQGTLTCCMTGRAAAAHRGASAQLMHAEAPIYCITPNDAELWVCCSGAPVASCLCCRHAQPATSCPRLPGRRTPQQARPAQHCLQLPTCDKAPAGLQLDSLSGETGLHVPGATGRDSTAPAACSVPARAVSQHISTQL